MARSSYEVNNKILFSSSRRPSDVVVTQFYKQSYVTGMIGIHFLLLDEKKLLFELRLVRFDKQTDFQHATQYLEQSQ